MKQSAANESSENAIRWLNEENGDVSPFPEEGWTALVPEKLLSEALDSKAWYKRRCELLHQYQSKMQDPERTVVCDILANGHLLCKGDGQFDPVRYGHMAQANAEKEVFQGQLQPNSTDRCDEWQPIATAPKDRPILAWCVHSENAYFEEDAKCLTAYGANCEGLSHAPDGPAIVVWGEEYTEGSLEEGYFTMPAWWFVAGSDFEVVANPTHWKEVSLKGPAA